MRGVRGWDNISSNRFDLLNIRVVLQHVNGERHPQFDQFRAEIPVGRGFVYSVERLLEVFQRVAVAFGEERQVAADQWPHKESVQDAGERNRQSVVK